MITSQLLLIHRWLGVLMGGLILVAAVTTLGLNHQDWLRGRIEANQPPQGPFDQYVLTAAQDPRLPSHLLMGTHAGLYESRDGGATWQTIIMPVKAKQVGTLRYDPAVPGRVYALLRDEGLFVSADDGAHWQHEDLPVGKAGRTQYLALASSGTPGLTVVTNQGVYRQPQALATWQQTPRPVAVRHETSRKLVQLLYDLHDGQYWGSWGVPLTDLVSVTLIILGVSGYALFFRFGGRKRRRRPRQTGPISEATATAAQR
ncbi:MAG: PepSY domain-containing protein [Candidatus Sericytochromatia bacterium]|nr:PepSY domain-containing protein [Candidatus Sericytochromatia bacterium]